MGIIINNNQASAILTEIVAQASGKALGSIDSTNFMTVAQIGLETGYEKMTNALSLVLSKTIFSVRPYTRKLKNLEADTLKWGSHVRKINYIDGDIEDDQRQPIEDLSSVDMQKINKPKVVQTNFYGSNTYQRHVTIFKDQWDAALQGPEEFARFVAGIMSNVYDQLEQVHEGTARFTLCNLMNGAQKVKLITLYNAQKGTQLTYPDIMKPENFVDFYKFAYATIRTYSQYMTDRTTNYHTNITGKTLKRHTPLDKQRMYTLTKHQNLIESTVLSSVYNDKYLKNLKSENLNFWQSPADPECIQGKFTYMMADGSLKQTAGTTKSAPIFAVLFDEEAAGYTTVNQWQAPAPFNAAGGYQNTFWHFTDRYWNDFTENALTFTLE